MAAYSFVTVWNIPAPPGAVWDALNDTPRYPEWWPSFVGYTLLEGPAEGVGSRAERVVKGRLPYSLRYRTTVTAYDPPREVAYDADGDLRGRGKFVVEPDGAGAGTRVTFYWDVATTSRLMNALAPLLKPLFAWNHNAVMSQGERGLTRKLSGTA